MNNVSFAITDIFSAFIELLIIITFYNAVLSESKFQKYSKNIWIIIIFTAWIITSILTRNLLLAPIIIYLEILCLSFLYKSSLYAKLLTSFIIFLLFVFSELFMGLIISIMIINPVEDYANSLAYYVFGLIGSRLIVYALVKLISLNKFFAQNKISRYFLIPLASLPLSTLFIFYSVGRIFILEQSNVKIIFVFAIFFSVISNILMYLVFGKLLELEKRKNDSERLNEILNNKYLYFEELAEKQKASNMAIHDTKNNMIAINSLIEHNEIEKAKAKIEELCGTIFKPLQYSNTGNIAIDALINSKQEKIKKLNIDFKINIHISNSNNIDDVDLCVVLGNALDNAIEACEKIIDNVREIKVNMIQKENHITLEVINTNYIDLKIENDELIKTSKKDKKLHGYGLQSMRQIVNKYNGTLNFFQKDNLFYLIIYLEN